MKVSILQYDIAWLAPQENLTYIEGKLRGLPMNTDLVILPEMFPTGVTTAVEGNAETMSGPSVSFMKKWAEYYGFAMCGSILILEDNKYYNRFVFVTPEGQVHTYDKRHRFTLGGEHLVVEAGQSCEIIEYKGWRIKPQICYDLRFPVWSRNTENYDLLIYVANWPKARDFAYETLIRARAIENQCYVCACNRIGVDGSKIVYNGNSLVIDARGLTLDDAKSEETIINTYLDKAELEKFRRRFTVLEDGDSFEIH